MSLPIRSLDFCRSCFVGRNLSLLTTNFQKFFLSNSEKLIVNNERLRLAFKIYIFYKYLRSHEAIFEFSNTFLAKTKNKRKNLSFTRLFFYDSA